MIDLIPDINSFSEFLMYYAPGGFICGRHMAGLAYENGQKAVEKYEIRLADYEKNRHWQSEADRPSHPSPYTRSFFAFLGGYVTWPFIYGGWITTKAIKGTPGPVWQGLHRLFIKSPPKRIRRERKLKTLQEKTAELEKELKL